jgi:hypothetical protein
MLFVEAEEYRDDLIDRAHVIGLRIVVGIGRFHGPDSALAQRPGLWPVLETGERRPRMEWYVGFAPTHDDCIGSWKSGPARQTSAKRWLDSGCAT